MIYFHIGSRYEYKPIFCHIAILTEHRIYSYTHFVDGHSRMLLVISFSLESTILDQMYKKITVISHIMYRYSVILTNKPIYSRRAIYG